MRRWLLLALLLPLTAQADERILSFHTDIVVKSDSWIEVTETITVTAEGNRIRRGIYRDLPTRYFDQLKNAYEVSIEPLAVLRNDRSEDFHVKQMRDGMRVYFGNAERFIEHGEHTYTFRYRASRMLGFFEQHDELYWNVTGFEWAFPIDEASARVSFEFDVAANALTHEAYTGAFGAQGRDYSSGVSSDPAVSFKANSPLSPVNGLTIVVGWPKGLVAEPSGVDRAIWLIKDNRNLLAALIGLLVVLAYYIPVWRHFGKDPEPGVVVTRYEPPTGFSPASLRYIRQMYYDNKVMTAAIINLAVKGYLQISARGADHSLQRTTPARNAPELAAGERELHDALFAEGDTAELDDAFHARLGGARSAHKKSLEADYSRGYFKRNGLLNVPPVLMLLLAAVISLSIGTGPSLFVILTIGVSIATVVGFAIVMRTPTLRGRKLLDQVQGFEEYLEVAEKYELNLRAPPEKTPDLFEKMLPFALALGVEQNWAEKFAAVLAGVRSPDGRAYQPSWYDGKFSVNNLSASTQGLSSGLSSAISSSVTPPGSSSGGGGGGFSGGGGGGGGGGGW